MPSVDDNRRTWDAYQWPEDGDEWSAPWGGASNQWRRSIFPRITAYLPVRTILEIGPGHGRWSRFLIEQCARLLLVDSSAACIEVCKQRFVDAARPIEYHVNDGYSLGMVTDGSVDFAFSFDSLVHAEIDVLRAYVTQLECKLSADGVAFLHHSNTGAYPLRVALARRLPERARRRVRRITRALPNIAAWRAESVTAAAVASACEAAGLCVMRQELINWCDTVCLVDCLTTITRRASAHAGAPAELVSNPHFMGEAVRPDQSSEI